MHIIYANVLTRCNGGAGQGDGRGRGARVRLRRARSAVIRSCVPTEQCRRRVAALAARNCAGILCRLEHDYFCALNIVSNSCTVPSSFVNFAFLHLVR